MKRSELKEAVSKVIDNRLSDWDKESSFNRQLAELVDSIFETLDEESALSNVPNNAICVFLDGNAFCACRADFVDLQVSIAGFGPTREEAIKSLEDQESAKYAKVLQKLNGG